MPLVYLAHCPDDKEFAKMIAERLGNTNEDIWVDGCSLSNDESLLDAISCIIDDIDVIAVILSMNSLNMKWVKNDVDHILKNKLNDRMIKLIPIPIKNCTPPVSMLDMIIADFSDAESRVKNGIDGEFNKLVDDILKY